MRRRRCFGEAGGTVDAHAGLPWIASPCWALRRARMAEIRSNPSEERRYRYFRRSRIKPESVAKVRPHPRSLRLLSLSSLSPPFAANSASVWQQ